MATKSTTIKIDVEVKEQAQQLFEDLGLTFSGAITIFLKQAIREQAIPFRIGNTPNATTLKTINEAQNHQHIIGPFNSITDVMENLNAED